MFNNINYQVAKSSKTAFEQSQILGSFRDILTTASDVKLYNRLYNCNKSQSSHFFGYFERLVLQKEVTLKTAKKFITLL